MNQRVTGVISKKYLGDPKHNSRGFPMRMDAVYVNGVRYGYFSNAPKENPSLDAITDRYPECVEGMKVTIEYDVTENNGKTYHNIKDMEPADSTLPADDPVARMARSKVPAHLTTPAKEIDDPMPDLSQPPQGPRSVPSFSSTGTTMTPPVGDAKDWQIARSVAVKVVADCIVATKMDDLRTWWIGDDSEIVAGEELCNRLARYIVEGR